MLVSPQWIRNAKKLKTSINVFFAEDRGLKPIFSKVVGCKFADDSSVDINWRCGMNSGSNVIFTKISNLINVVLTSVNTTDKLGSFSVPTTRVERPTGSYYWIRNGHDIEEATADRVSNNRGKSDYIKKMILKL